MIALAGRAATDLNTAATIEGAELGDLVGNNLFEDVDRTIISGLARQVAERTITPREVADVVCARQSSIWIDEYRSLSEAILAASELLTAISTLDTSMTSFDDGLARYRRDWFTLDQLYRHFIRAVRTTEHGGPLELLRAQVESFYTNQFLFPLGEATRDEKEEVLRLAIEGRKRVKDQIVRIDSTMAAVDFGYADREGEWHAVTTLEEDEYPGYYRPGGDVAAFDDSIHDRSITTDTGWRIVLGRGLDIFQYVRNDPFDLASSLQEFRQVRAFSVTYVREG